MTLKHQYYLGILAILLFLRFVWQPVVDWQQVTANQLLLKEAQLLKMESLLSQSDSLKEQDEETQTLLSKAKRFLPSAQSVESFKLSIQNEMETLAKDKKLRVQRYSWFPGSQVSSEMVKEVLELRLTGPVEGVVAFVAELETREQFIVAEYINFNFPSARAGKPTWFNGSIRIAFYAELRS